MHLLSPSCITWYVLDTTYILFVIAFKSQLNFVVCIFDRDLKPSNIFLAEDGSISVGKLCSELV